MKKLIFIGLVSMVLVSCSSPKNIVLTDGSVIRTKDDPEYKRKLDAYEYEDEQGNKAVVNANSVKLIQPIDAEIPIAPEEEVPVPVTLPEEPTEPVEMTEMTEVVEPVEAAPVKEVPTEEVPTE